MFYLDPTFIFTVPIDIINKKQKLVIRLYVTWVSILTSQPQVSASLRRVSFIPDHALIDPPVGAMHGGDDELLPVVLDPEAAARDAGAEGDAVVKPLQPRRWPPAPGAVDDSCSTAVYHLVIQQS